MEPIKIIPLDPRFTDSEVTDHLRLLLDVMDAEGHESPKGQAALLEIGVFSDMLVFRDCVDGSCRGERCARFGCRSKLKH